MQLIAVLICQTSLSLPFPTTNKYVKCRQGLEIRVENARYASMCHYWGFWIVNRKTSLWWWSYWGRLLSCLKKKDQMHSMLMNMFIISLSWESIKNKSKNFICSPLLSSIRSWNLTIFIPISAEAGFIMCLWFFENNYFLAGYLLYSLLCLYSFILKRTGIPE